MSVAYAALAIGWSRPLWSLHLLPQTQRRWLYIGGSTGYFIVATSSIGFMVAGLVSERLQTLLPKVRETNFPVVVNVLWLS